MLIDTNVYTALDRGSYAATQLIKRENTVAMPFCVVGELQYGFLLGSNYQQNQNRLDRFLSMDQIEVIFPSLETAILYGELSTYCRQKGRALSNNDLWIASLAMENEMRFATFDRDFLALEGKMGDMLILLED